MSAVPRFALDAKVRKNFSSLVGVVRSVTLPTPPQVSCQYFVMFPDGTGCRFWESEITAA